MATPIHFEHFWDSVADLKTDMDLGQAGIVDPGVDPSTTETYWEWCWMNDDATELHFPNRFTNISTDVTSYKSMWFYDVTAYNDIYVGGKIYDSGNTDTYIYMYLDGADEILNMQVGGISFVDFMESSAGQDYIEFNPAGQDIDLKLQDSAGASLLYADAANSRIGVGTATPDNKLHSEVADAGTNTTVYPFKVTHSSSGTPANNIGVGIALEAETKYGTADGDIAAQLRAYWTDVLTSTGEDSAFAIDVYSNDAFVEALQLRHNCGGFYLGGDALEAWAYPSLAIGDPAHGIFGGTTYDASFGLFDNIYYDGAWKLANADYGSRLELEDGAILMYVFGTGAADSAVSTTALVKLNTAGVLNGYSDAGSTQTWSIACATGNAQFAGEVIAAGNSKVETSSTTAQSMRNADYTTVVFEIEDKDLLAEYDNATGIFTAGKAGTYAVSWQVGSASAAWGLLEAWLAALSRNNSTSEGDMWWGQRWICFEAATMSAYSVGSAIVTLAAGNTLRVKVMHDQGDAVNTSGTEYNCYFHIARIA